MADDVSAVKVVLVIAGVAMIGVGVLVLDWVTYDVAVSGPFPFETQGGTGLDVDEGKISLIAGAATGLLGLLGLTPTLSRQMVGLGMIVGAIVVCAATLYFLANVSDETIRVPGIVADVEASIAPGGPVTVAGAVVLAIAGAVFALERQ